MPECPDGHIRKYMINNSSAELCTQWVVCVKYIGIKNFRGEGR